MTDTEENKPHRPPKYVEGHYKPHFGDPDADWAIYAWWGGEEIELYTTDSDGDAAGVVRGADGTPAYEGGGHIAGHVYDGEIRLQGIWKDRIDVSKVERALESVRTGEQGREVP